MGQAEPETGLRPLRLHHHAFVVKDMEATRRFYEEVIGLPLVATWCEEEDFGGGPVPYCHTFFEMADGSCLAFFQFATPEAAAHFGHEKPPSPFDHVAMLATPEIQEQVAVTASQAGIPTTVIDHGYCRSLYVPDPDGMLVELTVDAPAALADAAERRGRAHAELSRWLSGDHGSNNGYRR